jgi:uncharacterized protein (TIGR03435 family)
MWFAPAIAGQQSPDLRFEVTSVKKSHAGDAGIGGTGWRVVSGILDWRNVTLLTVIENAYSVARFQIRGAPGWLETQRYDISAKAPEANPTPEAFSLMVRKLLDERFGMVSTIETAEYPLLKLVSTSSKSKMIKSPEKATGCRFSTFGHIDCSTYGATMEMLARQLQSASGRQLPVRDWTDLSGIFRFDLIWAPDDSKIEADPRPSLEAALRELGLKLERSTGPMPTLIIQKINRDPVEN